MQQKIFIAVNDMFFAGRIRGVAQRLGLRLQFVNQADQILEMARSQRPDLIIFDLNDRRCCPIETIRQMKADPILSEIKTMGFYSHVQVQLHQQATEAGCDQVLPKSAFSQLLPTLLWGQPRTGK